MRQDTEDNVGICACCFGQFKVEPRNNTYFMVNHGYERPGHGYLIGGCRGTEFPPYEYSTDGTVWLLGDRRQKENGLLESLERLKETPPLMKETQKTVIQDGKRTQVVEKRFVKSNEREYESLKNRYQWKFENELEAVRHHITMLEKRIADWKKGNIVGIDVPPTGKQIIMRQAWDHHRERLEEEREQRRLEREVKPKKIVMMYYVPETSQWGKWRGKDVLENSIGILKSFLKKNGKFHVSSSSERLAIDISPNVKGERKNYTVIKVSTDTSKILEDGYKFFTIGERHHIFDDIEECVSFWANLNAQMEADLSKLEKDFGKLNPKLNEEQMEQVRQLASRYGFTRIADFREVNGNFYYATDTCLLGITKSMNPSVSSEDCSYFLPVIGSNGGDFVVYPAVTKTHYNGVMNFHDKFKTEHNADEIVSCGWGEYVLDNTRFQVQNKLNIEYGGV